MFRITFLADDKKLPKALKALDRLAYDVRVNPLKGSAAPMNGAQAREAALAKLPSHFTRAQFIEATGASPVSASYHLRALREGGLIKGGGTGRDWSKVTSRAARRSSHKGASK